MDDVKGDLGGMLEKLMGDPQVMELVKKLKESDAAAGKSDSPAAVPDGAETAGSETERGASEKGTAADPGAILDSLAPLLKTAGRASPGTENRNRLLSALKPYVNGERRDMIDKVTSISKLTTLLDAANRRS